MVSPSGSSTRTPEMPWWLPVTFAIMFAGVVTAVWTPQFLAVDIPSILVPETWHWGLAVAVLVVGTAWTFLPVERRFGPTLSGNVVLAPAAVAAALLLSLTSSTLPLVNAGDASARDQALLLLRDALVFGLGGWFLLCAALAVPRAQLLDPTASELGRIKERHEARLNQLILAPTGRRTMRHASVARSWFGSTSEPTGDAKGYEWTSESGSASKELEAQIDAVPWYALDTGKSVLAWSTVTSEQHRTLLRRFVAIVDPDIHPTPAKRLEEDARAHLRAYVRETRHRLNNRTLHEQVSREATPTDKILRALRLANEPATPALPVGPTVAERLHALENALARRLTNAATSANLAVLDTLRELPEIERAIDEFILGNERRLAAVGGQLIAAMIATLLFTVTLLTIAVGYGATDRNIVAACVFFIIGAGGGQLFKLRPDNTGDLTGVPTYAVPRLATMQGLLVSGLVGVLAVAWVPVIEELADADLTLVSPPAMTEAVDAGSPAAGTPMSDTGSPQSTPGTGTPLPTTGSGTHAATPGTPVSGNLTDIRAFGTSLTATDSETPTPTLTPTPTPNPGGDSDAAGSDDEEPLRLADVYSLDNVVGYLLAFGFGALPGLFFSAIHRNINAIADAIGSLNAVFVKRPDTPAQ